MKNILIIDAAENCAYDIFAATDDEFDLLFPAPGQDIAFPDEILGKPAGSDSIEALNALWRRPVDKKSVNGLHGTIFYGLDFKKKYYPNRRDSDLTDSLARQQR
jgi:hypothetical protein